MPKDNENIQFFDDGPLVPTEPHGFSPEQMVRCEECLRANPPTRASCLYCAAALPAGERVVDLRTPVLRPIEESAEGYNNILLPKPPNSFAPEKLEEAAVFLELSASDLQRIIASGRALPLARMATREEAGLVSTKLESFGLEAIVVSDAELGLKDSPAVYIRAAGIDETGLALRQIGGEEGIQVSWQQIVLLVSGRFVTKRVESAERKGRRGEKEIVEATELFADELVMDIYVEDRTENFRIAANNFDFSSLPGKGVVAAENFSSLLKLIRDHAAQAEYDDLYLSIRQALNPVWPSGQHTESRGWRRESPGKYNIEAVTESSNANQFTRYSRLRHLLLKQAKIDRLE